MTIHKPTPAEQILHEDIETLRAEVRRLTGTNDRLIETAQRTWEIYLDAKDCLAQEEAKNAELLATVNTLTFGIQEKNVLYLETLAILNKLRMEQHS